VTEWHGWAGTILDVNLTTGDIKKKPLSRDMAVNYIGGRAFGAKILYDELEPGIDPLGPDNICIITQGPLSGTSAPACGRWELATKGPQTGIYLSANGGGFFGPEMKRAGYDIIILRGQSKKPVYLWIKDDQVELRDASHLWGKDTWETEEMIREELGDPKIQAIKIGPSGENMGIASCVVSNLSRPAAKGGPGAVWGSKKLKAIAVRGSQAVKLARPEEFRKLCQTLRKGIKDDPVFPTLSKYGTPALFADSMMDKGTVPGADEAPPALLSTEFAKDTWDKSTACSSCPIHCSHWYTVKDGKYKGDYGEGFEANSILFGTLMLRVEENRAWTCKYTTVCNKLGMHVDHPGYAIAWAMQLYEDGIITKEDTDGIEVTWGNEEAILELMHKIAYKEGIGDILDEYPLKAAKRLGRGSEKYVEHVKGMSGRGPGVEGSIEWTLALAVATRGRDHLTGAPEWCWLSYMKDPKVKDAMAEFGQKEYGNSRLITDHWYYTPEKSRLVYDTENTFALCDSTGICKFASEQCTFTGGYHKADFATLLSAATGVDFTTEDVTRAAERKMLVERAFNAREGIRRYDKLLDEYYRLRGCDVETGISTKGKLEKLGMKNVAAGLAKQGILPSASG